MFEGLLKKVQQYRGPLSSAEIAHGMNAARENAVRLAKDARLLFENERYASALALAVLSIEEAGKEPVLRGLAVASDDKQLQERWRDYRLHTRKNALWPLPYLFQQGASLPEDFLPMFEPKAKHPQMLDMVKQISLYTDTFQKGQWSLPEQKIPKKLAEGIVKVAEIFSSTRQITTEEIDLWIQYMKPAWNSADTVRDKAQMEWDKEMRRRGLIKEGTALSVETFFTQGYKKPR
jgi:AbiV family abortive infection protein